MKSASVSVAIPSYNSGHMVTEAIDSVLAQTVVPDEIIVVDDGSKDDTRERLAHCGERIRYIHQSNQGVAAARNRGVQEAHGDHVAFLDADDVWHPRKLDLQLRALAGRADLGLVGTSSFDWPAERLPEPDVLRGGELMVVPWEQLAVRNVFVTSSLLVRRDVLQRVGPFDTRLQGPEDHDLWLRIAEVAEVANLPLPLTGYRYVTGSLS